MANNRLLAVVTMMILAGSFNSAHADPTLEDLQTIDKLIQDGNWDDLYSFVNSNPRLTDGQTALATELQSFKADVEQGQLSSFDAALNDQQDNVRESVREREVSRRAATSISIY